MLTLFRRRFIVFEAGLAPSSSPAAQITFFSQRFDFLKKMKKEMYVAVHLFFAGEIGKE